jgi:acrylyl-CoA reductase (NADPH)
METLAALVRPAVLTDLPELGAAILKGGVQGRVVVDVNG